MAASEIERERDRYENRLKWERDMFEIKKDAREEGVEEGKIRLCQRLLKQAPTPPEQLAKMSLDDLRRLAEDLERQLLPSTS